MFKTTKVESHYRDGVFVNEHDRKISGKKTFKELVKERSNVKSLEGLFKKEEK